MDNLKFQAEVVKVLKDIYELTIENHPNVCGFDRCKVRDRIHDLEQETSKTTLIRKF